MVSVSIFGYESYILLYWYLHEWYLSWSSDNLNIVSFLKKSTINNNVPTFILQLAQVQASIRVIFKKFDI